MRKCGFGGVIGEVGVNIEGDGIGGGEKVEGLTRLRDSRAPFRRTPLFPLLHGKRMLTRSCTEPTNKQVNDRLLPHPSKNYFPQKL